MKKKLVESDLTQISHTHRIRRCHALNVKLKILQLNSLFLYSQTQIHKNIYVLRLVFSLNFRFSCFEHFQSNKIKIPKKINNKTFFWHFFLKLTSYKCHILQKKNHCSKTIWGKSELQTASVQFAVQSLKIFTEKFVDFTVLDLNENRK